MTGPTCDTCLSGYFNYSESLGCRPCDCNFEGTLDSICNNITGQCDCAKGVLGQTCDSCPDGSIGPSGLTEARCTSCFCNGFSMKCESAEGWYQALVSNSFGQNGGEGEGFKSNGVINNDSRYCHSIMHCHTYFLLLSDRPLFSAVKYQVLYIHYKCACFNLFDA